MDRISALRNVEDALADFENGDIDLATLERDVRAVLRTYATDFDGELSAFRAEADGGSGAQGRTGARGGADERGEGGEHGEADEHVEADDHSAVDGVVVLATSRDAARDRIRELVDDPGRFTVTAIDDP